MTESEIRKVFREHISDGYKNIIQPLTVGSNNSVNQIMFGEDLFKIHGNYLQLTKDEEETISKIAKRF